MKRQILFVLVMAVFLLFIVVAVEAATITYEFTFSSAAFSFDFGTGTSNQQGHFSYDDVLVPVFNGLGYRVIDFELDGLHFDPERDVYWVPQPQFDNTTIEIFSGGANDQWELFDQGGTLRFQLFANPDGVGGFSGHIAGNGVYATVTFLMTPVPKIIYVDDDGPADFNNIQAAIDDANNGDTIIVQPGRHIENINFLGKNIILTSTNPSDPNVVAATIIENTDHPAVKFSGTEDPSCMLIGFNINGTIDGLYYRTDPNGMPIRNHTRATISNCLISGNGACLAVIGFCDGTISNCLIADNFSTCGWLPVSTMNQCHGLIKNCTIVNNNPSDAVSVFMGTTTIENCIIYHNYAWWGVQPQVWVSKGGTLNISYSCIQGGLDGIYLDHSTATVDWGPGNIDADPCFILVGYRTDLQDGSWVLVEGDYHLLPDSPCINSGDPNYIAEPNETDLDGKPRIIGGRIDMGAYEYSPPIPAEARIVPRTINLASKGKWITAFLWLPEEYNVVDIDPNSVLLENEIQADLLKVDEEQQVTVAKFDRSEVQAILNAGEVELTITGQLTDGAVFEGTDIIRVIDKGGKK